MSVKSRALLLASDHLALATIARALGLEPIDAIDPHTSPSKTDPSLDGAETSYDEFVANLTSAGVSAHVTPHRAFSGDIAATWSRPIRFLWIDGDHTYEGALA